MAASLNKEAAFIYSGFAVEKEGDYVFCTIEEGHRGGDGA